MAKPRKTIASVLNYNSERLLSRPPNFNNRKTKPDTPKERERDLRIRRAAARGKKKGILKIRGDGPTTVTLGTVR